MWVMGVMGYGFKCSAPPAGRSCPNAFCANNLAYLFSGDLRAPTVARKQGRFGLWLKLWGRAGAGATARTESRASVAAKG